MNIHRSALRRLVGAVAAATMTLFIAGCPSTEPPTTYIVGGTVSGLSGTGLVLQNNGGDDRAISANGRFTFATEPQVGTPYAITVKRQPTAPAQNCTVADGSGTLNAADQSVNASIVCANVPTYPLEVVVNGLSGIGLVLQNNGGDDRAITSTGNHPFATSLAAGSAYDITVQTQPTSPDQVCTFSGNTHASGVMAAAPTGVVLTCTTVLPPPSVPVSVQVSGLAGSGLVLQNNGGDDLGVAANGITMFDIRAVGAGTAYNVTVKTQPANPAQTCTVSQGSGVVVDGGTVIMAAVTCVTDPVGGGSLQLAFASPANAAMGTLAPYVLTESQGVALTSVAWTFDGVAAAGGTTLAASGSVAFHVWNTPGAHSVAATATASGGRSATVSATVFAVGQPLAAGTFHSCALTINRAAKCWGNGNSGQMGNNTTVDATTPVDVAGLSGLLGLAAGDSHSCALKADGSVACWGSNIEGELGNTATFHGSVNPLPLAVDGLGGVVALAAGRYHTCALKSDGTVACFGQNTEKELGTGTNLSQSVAPVTVTGLGNVVALSAGGGYFTCALRANATVACWGSNSSGELGNNDRTVSQTGTPQQVLTEQGAVLGPVLALRSGNAHSCAIVDDGTYSVYCWGNNANSQVSGVAGNHYGAVKQAGLANVLMLSLSTYASCALDSSLNFRCWGMNALGESGGNGGTQQLSTPTALVGLQGSSAPDYAGGGNEFLCALKGDGSAACVGRGGDGQLGNGAALDATALRNVGAPAGTFWRWVP